MDSFFLQYDGGNPPAIDLDKVSILVLMDSFFLHIFSDILKDKFEFCLNPCFNGFFFLTSSIW